MLCVPPEIKKFSSAVKIRLSFDLHCHAPIYQIDLNCYCVNPAFINYGNPFRTKSISPQSQQMLSQSSILYLEPVQYTTGS